MKITRAYLGKVVSITWRDPVLTEADEETRKLGRASLARQVEYGRLSDITDGVVEVTHTETFHPGDLDRPGKRTRSTIQEEIIESIQVFEPAQPVSL